MRAYMQEGGGYAEIDLLHYNGMQFDAAGAATATGVDDDRMRLVYVRDGVKTDARWESITVWYPDELMGYPAFELRGPRG